jgi:undecaprenyl-diphosphatase
VPGIAAAGGYEGLKLATSSAPVNWLPMFVGLVCSALAGLVCIHVMIRFIERIGLLPFTVYRLLVALVILLVAA